MFLTHEHSKSNHKYTVGYNPATKTSEDQMFIYCNPQLKTDPAKFLGNTKNCSPQVHLG